MVNTCQLLGAPHRCVDWIHGTQLLASSPCSSWWPNRCAPVADQLHGLAQQFVSASWRIWSESYRSIEDCNRPNLGILWSRQDIWNPNPAYRNFASHGAGRLPHPEPQARGSPVSERGTCTDCWPFKCSMYRYQALWPLINHCYRYSIISHHSSLSTSTYPIVGIYLLVHLRED